MGTEEAGIDQKEVARRTYFIQTHVLNLPLIRGQIQGIAEGRQGTADLALRRGTVWLSFALYRIRKTAHITSQSTKAFLLISLPRGAELWL